MGIEIKAKDVGIPRVEPVKQTGGSAEPSRGEALPVDGKGKPRVEVQAPDLSRAISNLNQFLKDSRRDLRFQVDESSGRTIIRIVNPDTGEIVRQIPSEEVLKTARTLREAGILLDAKAEGSRREQRRRAARALVRNLLLHPQEFGERMGTITSTGVGSGIDIESLVAKLVSAEGTPKQTQLAQDEAKAQARISAYGSLKAALSQIQSSVATLKDANAFKVRSSSVADDKILTATAGTTAAPGTYNVEVVRLAQGAKLVSGPLATAGTAVGTGSLTIASNGASFTVDVTGANNTLAGIRDAINAAPGNAGVAASIVTANDGARLVLTSTSTGTTSSITVTAAGGDGGLNSLVYDPGNGTTNLTQIQAAQDARVIVDGFTYDSKTNAVSGALDGVTLNLKTTTATGVTTAVTVAIDNSAVKKSIGAFVTSYNQAYSMLRALGAYDSATKQGGALLGDPTLRGVLTALRNEVGSASATLSDNRYKVLSDIGITTNLDGSLKIDDAKVTTALTTDSAAVQRLFSSDGGIAKRIDQQVNDFTKIGGVVDSRTTGLQSTIKDIGKRQEALNTQLTAYEKRLRAQFTAMDVLVAQLKQTGQNLLSTLSSISTTSG